MYTLDTKNLPILSTIKGWKYGFNSPFKAEVYFICHPAVDRPEMGHAEPGHDARSGIRPGSRAGVWDLRIQSDRPGTFLKELVATDPSFETYEIATQLRNVDRLAVRRRDGRRANIPMLDLAGNYEKVSKIALEKIAPEMAEMGLTITQFFVENISLPPEVEQALDKRTRWPCLGT